MMWRHVPVAASGSGKARAKSVRYHSVRKKSGVMCAACSHPNAVGEWLASVTSNSCNGEGENNRQRKKQVRGTKNEYIELQCEISFNSQS